MNLIEIGASAVGFLILLSTLTKNLGLPAYFSLTRVFSKLTVFYIRLGIIAAFVIWAIYKNNYIFEQFSRSSVADNLSQLQGPSSLSDGSSSGSSSSSNENVQSSSAPSAGTLIDVNPIFYQPGTFMVRGSGYVPNYANSLFVNKTTTIPLTSPIINSAAMNGGFCEQSANNVLELEEKCNNLTSEMCASTRCCALLGGAKCVASNEQGPLLRSNYSDFLVKNKDLYYYQGKCFGNCPNNVSNF